MHKIFLGIGGNIGNKRLNFNRVLELIEKKVGTLTLKSSIYETPPWGFQSDDTFWNQVVLVETKLKAMDVLGKINEIEAAFERKRGKERYASRQMDVDILYFDELCVASKKLTIPHPRISQRKFVLVPLCDIAPAFVHPLLKKTSLELLENCQDKSHIKKVVIGN